MYYIFEAFVKKMVSNFRRISRATKNELTIEDLHNDAWIIAKEIGEKRERDIDFSDPNDADLILSAVYVRKVKRGDWHMRKSVRIDKEDEGDGATRWVDRLPASASSDPLIFLLQQEAALNTESMLAASYSQAAAYVMIFVNFKNDRQAVCAYLVISDGMLVRRVASAENSVKVQPSLFDGIKKIDSSFMPLPGRQYVVRIEQHHAASQWYWEF